MKTLRALWRDEAGMVLSAEMVLVGTLGVIGATVGLSAVSTAVNDELTELAFAIRSLDQSYCVPAQEGCNAWTAGSCYRQRPVEESLAELQGFVDRAARGEKDDDDDDDTPIKQKSSEKKPEKQKSDRGSRDDDELTIDAI